MPLSQFSSPSCNRRAAKRYYASLPVRAWGAWQPCRDLTTAGPITDSSRARSCRSERPVPLNLLLRLCSQHCCSPYKPHIAQLLAGCWRYVIIYWTLWPLHKGLFRSQQLHTQTSASFFNTATANMWTALVLPLLAALALPASALPEPPTKVLAARQSVVTPPPCKAISPPPSAAETEQRFNTFADEFLVKKNLTAAFEFISSTYIVRDFAS